MNDAQHFTFIALDFVPPPGPEADPPGIPHEQRQASPGTVHSGRYGQQVDGTHPTGMHSCSTNISDQIVKKSLLSNNGIGDFPKWSNCVFP